MKPLLFRLVSLWVAACLVLGSAPGVRAQAPETVSLPADWSVGQRIRVEVERQREDIRGGTVASRIGSRSVAEVEVVEKLPDGYVMRWRWGPTELLAAPGTASTAQEQLLQRLSAAIAGVPIDVRTDSFGRPLGVANLDEVAEANRRAMDEVVGAIAAEGAPAATVALLAQVLSAATTPETVAASALKEPGLFMLAAGRSYPRTGRLGFADQLESPFGGPPAPSVGTFELSSQEPPPGALLVGWNHNIDPVQGRAWVNAFLNQLAAQTGLSAPGQSAPANLQLMLEDTGLFAMDTTTGWPRAAAWARTALVGIPPSVQGRVEQINFRVTE